MSQLIFVQITKKDNKLIKKAKEIIYSKLEGVLRVDEICKELAMSSLSAYLMLILRKDRGDLEYLSEMRQLEILLENFLVGRGTNRYA